MMVWIWLAVLLCCSGLVSASETALFGLSRRALYEFGRSHRPLRRRVYLLMQTPGQVLMTVLIANTAVNVAIFAASFIALRGVTLDRPASRGLLGSSSDAGWVREGIHAPATEEGVLAPATIFAPAMGIAVLIAVIAFGEIAPKTVALSRAESLASPAAGLISVLKVLLAPLRWVLNTLFVTPLVRLATPTSSESGEITTGELKELVEHSARDGVIDSKEHEMLQAVVAAGQVSTREIMTPRVDIASVRYADLVAESAVRTADPARSRQALVKRMQRTAHRAVAPRRLVVCGRDLDDICGVVYARDLYINPRAPIETLIRPVQFIPEQVNLVQLLRHFRREEVRFAIVVDEYGGTAGLVSIDHVTKWILGTPTLDRPTYGGLVGPASDEGSVREGILVPATPATQQIDENTYRLSGNLSARHWAERFAVRQIDRHIDTVGGLILATLGRMPKAGDSVRIGNLTLTVEQVDKRRIERILLRRDVREPPTEHER
ncbi:MAG: hemolysin family protein [Planctomycetota bacterium]|jgi:putative hemolysin